MCFPFSKFKLAHVLIGALDHRDPGQVVSLWKKCLDIAEILQAAKYAIRELAIGLIDEGDAERSTCNEGKPQMNEDDNGPSMVSDEDLVSITSEELERKWFDGDDEEEDEDKKVSPILSLPSLLS